MEHKTCNVVEGQSRAKREHGQLGERFFSEIGVKLVKLEYRLVNRSTRLYVPTKGRYSAV